MYARALFPGALLLQKGHKIKVSDYKTKEKYRWLVDESPAWQGIVAKGKLLLPVNELF